MALTFDYYRMSQGFKTLRWLQEGYVVDQTPIQKPNWTVFPQFYDYFKFSRMTPHEGMSAEDVAFAERQANRFAYVHGLNKLAEIYTLNGQIIKARRVMQTLHSLHPYSYPEYYDYWAAQALLDSRYGRVFLQMPNRDAN